MMHSAVYLWDKLGYLVCCLEDKKLYICLKTRKMEEEDCLKAQGKRSKITDTMMKFASFETIVELIYKHAIPTPKDQCSKPLQLGVSFAGGYVAGVFCAIVSHPADNLVSFLNNAKGATVGDAVKKLGLWGLFTRGLPLRIVMIGTLTGAQWGIYDAFKVFVGLPTTGGVTPAPAALPAPAKV
ncbi:hypothetical protein Cgig2_031589 [Carnegiea gigantea]|uniref:Uncharacterized protein n=1 Tax=Carnegiea gigantea TaxID=171969 RepID=A0A9Q1KC79_9CARY|nr:hypothetical protein Cgig2_031589 [Carnegiea gigantea]